MSGHVDPCQVEFQDKYRRPLELDVARCLFENYHGAPGDLTRLDAAWDDLAPFEQENWIADAKELCDIFDASVWAALE